jgi:hypothetical protein
MQTKARPTSHPHRVTVESVRRNPGYAAALLVLALLLGGCAPDVIKAYDSTTASTTSTASTTTDEIKWHPPLSKAEWDICAEEEIEKTRAECAADGITESCCFGAGGTGYLTAPLEECGWYPAPSVLAEWHRELIDDRCRYRDSVTNMDMQTLRVFVQFDPKGDYMREVSSRCKHVYEEHAEFREEENRRREEAYRFKLSVGLPETVVFEQLGAPISITESVSSSGVEKLLAYESNLQIKTVNGKVASWTQTKRSRIGISLSDADLGAIVVQVEPGSPAERAGIAPGNRILMVGSANVTTSEDVRSALVRAILAKHRSVLLLVEQEDEERFVAVPFD